MSDSGGLDRRVTVGRMMSLLLQVGLAALCFHLTRRGLNTQGWGELYLLGAVGAIMAGALLGMSTLNGVMRAALGSIAYRVALIFSSGFIALVAAGFVLLFVWVALLMIPGSFRLPGAISGGISLTAGLGTMLTLGGAVLMFGAYAYVSALICISLFRSDSAIKKHWLFRTIDESDPYTEPIPFHPWPGDVTRPSAPPRHAPLVLQVVTLAPEPEPPPPPVTVPPTPFVPPPFLTTSAPLKIPLTCTCSGDVKLDFELKHAEILSQADYPLWGDKVRARYAQVRRCPVCATIWWMELAETRHDTYERDSYEGGPVASSIVVSGFGLRCGSIPEAEALTPWYPELMAAHRRFLRALPEGAVGATPEQTAEATAAHGALLALASRHPSGSASLVLPRDWITWQPSELVVRALRPRLRKAIDVLEKSPEDASARGELASLQSRCAEARAKDPALPHDLIQLEELWTVDLAGVDAFEFCAYGIRPPAGGIGQVRAGIAQAWEAFHRKARWPSPAVEFRILLVYASRLEALELQGEPWKESERVGLRLRTLIKNSGLKPADSFVVSEWLSKLTGYPSSHSRLKVGIRR